MRIRTIGLFIVAASALAACAPAPGSADWCKQVMEGKLKPSEADAQQHGMECVNHMMNGALGDLKPPGQ